LPAIVLSARWDRPIAKYGERSYRIVALDAGHLAQNILLVATALGVAGCPIAGFHDDALAAELGLDPREESPLYVITLGYPCTGSR
jgi:SagB-type dehydrogenase family enzyme